MCCVMWPRKTTQLEVVVSISDSSLSTPLCLTAGIYIPDHSNGIAGCIKDWEDNKDRYRDR